MGVKVRLYGSIWDTDDIRGCGQTAVKVANEIQSQLETLQGEYTKLSESFEGLVATDEQATFGQ